MGRQRITRWFRQLYAEVRDRMRHSGKISPENIRRLAAELRELACIAERVTPDPLSRNARLRRIQTEAGQLIDLSGRRDFHRLSAQRRLELHQSLEQSRAQLLDVMRSAPPPTDRVQ